MMLIVCGHATKKIVMMIPLPSHFRSAVSGAVPDPASGHMCNVIPTFLFHPINSSFTVSAVLSSGRLPYTSCSSTFLPKNGERRLTWPACLL